MLILVVINYNLKAIQKKFVNESFTAGELEQLVVLEKK
jgi:hypothetical protein